MYSLLFLPQGVIKFRYSMKAIKNIKELGINLLCDDLRTDISKKQLWKVAYIGSVDISYEDFMELINIDAETIINFAIEAIQEAFEVPEFEDTDQEVEWEWGEEWEGIEKVEFKEKEVIEVENNKEDINIEEMLKNAISMGVSVQDFWNSTPYELFIQIRLNGEKFKSENDSKIYFEYLNAYLQRVKKMPPISDFVKIKQNVMTDEQLFGVVKELDKVANAE